MRSVRSARWRRVCDLVLHGNGALIGEPVRDLMAEIRDVAAASTPMSPESLARAKRAAEMRRIPAPSEEPALVLEWQQLLAVA